MGAPSPPVSLGRPLFHRGGGYTSSRRGLTCWRGIRRLAEGSPSRGGRHIPRHGVTAPPGVAEAQERERLTVSRKIHRLAEGSPSRGGRHVPRHGVTAPPGVAEDTPARGGLTVWRGIHRLADGSPSRGGRHVPRHGVTAPPGVAEAQERRRETADARASTRGRRPHAVQRAG